jgi:Ni,Fe-hydrogenase III large subunit
MSRSFWDEEGGAHAMPALSDLLGTGRLVPDHRPCPRAVVEPGVWSFAAAQLATGRWTMLGLWGEQDAVHMAIAETERGGLGVISLDCPDGRFPSVGARHPPALRLERAIRDLSGLVAEGSPDMRPWLAHDAAPYPFLPVEGDCLHRIAVGPIHAGIIEPGHFRFAASGETVVRLEARLGYAHKGVEALMAGADPDRAAQLAGRVSGDSTVAYAFAFSRAAEAALGIEAPSRAVWLRALMAEVERLANHLGDIGAICNDAAFALIHAHCAVLREDVLRAADAAFGHRLMRDRIAPGGVTTDLRAEGVAALRACIAGVGKRFPAIVSAYDNTPSLQDRTVGTGVLSGDLALRYGAGGYVGRASGRDFDARRAYACPPYDALSFSTPTRGEGDVNARVWVRILEAEQSLSLIGQILDRLPAGPVRVAAHGGAGEGLALAEGFRGDVLAWVRIGADGLVARCHLRDPSWFQWPLLEAAVEGDIVADFPLCNKSFNCSYSGHDL